MPEVIANLLDKHRSDRAGRCVACTQGGRGAPMTQFPCTLYALASAAQMLREREPPAARGFTTSSRAARGRQRLSTSVPASQVGARSR